MDSWIVDVDLEARARAGQGEQQGRSGGADVVVSAELVVVVEG